MRAPVFSADTVEFLGSVDTDIFGVPPEDRRRLPVPLLSSVHDFRPTSAAVATEPIEVAEFEFLSVHRWNDKTGTKNTGWVLFTNAPYADLYNRVPGFRPSNADR